MREMKYVEKDKLDLFCLICKCALILGKILKFRNALIMDRGSNVFSSSIMCFFYFLNLAISFVHLEEIYVAGWPSSHQWNIRYIIYMLVALRYVRS